MFDALYPAAMDNRQRDRHRAARNGNICLPEPSLGAEVTCALAAAGTFSCSGRVPRFRLGEFGRFPEAISCICTDLLAVVVFGIRRVVRFNRAGMLPGGGEHEAAGGRGGALSQSDGFYRFQGYLVLAALALLLAWPLVAWRMGSRQGRYDLGKRAYLGSDSGIEQLSGPGWLRLCP